MSIKLRKKADEIYKQIAGQPVPDAELGDGAERSEAKSSEAGVEGLLFYQFRATLAWNWLSRVNIMIFK